MSDATERTVWEVRTYVVTYDESTGWEIIGSQVDNPYLELYLRVRSRPLGNPWDPVKDEYRRCELGVQAIREAFDCQGQALELDGSDTRITVTREWDGYPMGEMRCLSHTSLNPVRPREVS